LFFDARAASFVRVLLFASREFVHFSKEEEEEKKKKKTLDFGSLEKREEFSKIQTTDRGGKGKGDAAERCTSSFTSS
jgi:hypothetical protein